MPEKMSWTSSVEVVGGPKVSAGDTIEVTAYDKIQVIIPDGGGSIAVDVQPSASDRVRVLAITSDRYGDGLTYVVEQEGENPPPVALDAPQVFAGAGALGLLGDAISVLTFTNDLPGEGQNATVTILVGRHATEPLS